MFEAGCDISEITNFLKEKLEFGIGVNKLTIIDPYFFKYDSQLSLTRGVMVETLEGFSSLRTLEVVTSSNYQVGKKEKLEEEILDVVPNLDRINIIHVNSFHDRFWIMNDEKGFVVGTSLSGMGKKHFFVQDNYLSENDIRVLLSLYRGN
ncbi:MAG: Unknown protein [uncultured Sulfurovum sp.]|uniref:Uncharacterized protein n=1 Tax=uncultured Sulfurovum sp. TaxID=269237 RepID=A0A6S6TX63_9BACT|nr:MAG: Unknown protein [uncultured Sulfurovum sp.]